MPPGTTSPAVLTPSGPRGSSSSPPRVRHPRRRFPHRRRRAPRPARGCRTSARRTCMAMPVSSPTRISPWETAIDDVIEVGGRTSDHRAERDDRRIAPGGGEHPRRLGHLERTGHPVHVDAIVGEPGARTGTRGRLRAGLGSARCESSSRRPRRGRRGRRAAGGPAPAPCAPRVSRLPTSRGPDAGPGGGACGPSCPA